MVIVNLSIEIEQSRRGMITQLTQPWLVWCGCHE